MEQTVETDKHEPVVEKLSLRDLLSECGLDDYTIFEGERLSLAPESFFASVLPQMEMCVISYNGHREMRLKSIQDNKKFAEYCLRKHIQDNGEGIAMPEKIRNTLLRLFGSPLYFLDVLIALRTSFLPSSKFAASN